MSVIATQRVVNKIVFIIVTKDCNMFGCNTIIFWYIMFYTYKQMYIMINSHISYINIYCHTDAQIKIFKI